MHEDGDFPYFHAVSNKNCSEQSLFYFPQLFITSDFGIVYCKNQFMTISFVVGMN